MRLIRATIAALLLGASPATAEPSQSVMWKEKDREFVYIKVKKFVDGVPTWLEILEVRTSAATMTWRSRYPTKLESCVNIERADARFRYCADFEIRITDEEDYGKMIREALARARRLLQK